MMNVLLKKCIEGTCNQQKEGPDESEGFGIAIDACILLSIILIIISICCCCYCCCFPNKYEKNKK